MFNSMNMQAGAFPAACCGVSPLLQMVFTYHEEDWLPGHYDGVLASTSWSSQVAARNFNFLAGSRHRRWVATMLVGTFLFILTAAVAAQTQTWPNEPAGSALISDHDFRTIDGGSPYPFRALWPNGNWIISDPADPYVYRAYWHHNQPTGQGGVPNLEGIGERTEIFLGFTWKPSDPFTGWGNNFNKVANIWTTRGILWFHGLHSLTTQGGPYWVDMSVGGVGADNSHLGNGVFTGTTQVSLGVWHRVEIYAKRSTNATSRDGIVRCWLDGVLQVNYTNVNFPSGFNQVQFTNSWDNYEPNFPNAYDEHRYGHVHVSEPHGSDFVPPPTITTAATELLRAQTGKPYLAALKASGGKPPYKWSISAGSLYPGLRLDSLSGVISGTPTLVIAKCSFTAKIRDSSVPAKEATKDLYILPNTTNVVARALSMSSKTLSVQADAGTLSFIFPLAGSNEGNLSICDLGGKKVCDFNGLRQTSMKLNATLKNGIYMARFSQGATVSTVRFHVVD